MKIRKDVIILISCVILYFANQYYFKSLGILFFNDHFNDLIAVPLYFAAINVILYYTLEKEVNSFKILFLMTIVLSFLGEYVSLYTRKGSVFDYWDVLCYFIGLVVYYIIKNYPKKVSGEKWFKALFLFNPTILMVFNIPEISQIIIVAFGNIWIQQSKGIISNAFKYWNNNNHINQKAHIRNRHYKWWNETSHNKQYKHYYCPFDYGKYSYSSNVTHHLIDL